ncbi:anhydro-N-acetylmuramic acid kinase [Pseudohongiella nitratireducens]|uniref:Anhydro-N-acetylmuramic acid kinase n=1 Tax=Pseudohongiella nitratireducens TaxID=1768907 RepID=A0A916QKN9_9GAMM|nr:anhydro-N-acetylmuramic acid kinase [Pseudohongiella nitratireducens]MDF1624101.1 anhydro-N-acetylmuramic acid kinase [Pseudohongiella nitratireducens]GFZ75574.1 anhydro-N-acetylmuramic acid kinase [Pseudohongiella nitratireducens]
MTASAGTGSFFIGLISGTSMDGIDAALIQLHRDAQPEIISTLATPYSQELSEALARLCLNQTIKPSQLGAINIQVGRAFAQAALNLLSANNLTTSDITAIGSHGQTVWHEPDSDTPFTMQLGDPNTIAHLTGITTVADFRGRDMAAGGQGAPLAPLFHQHCFYHPDNQAAIVNIGGIANLTTLADQKQDCPSGFDTGPGNVLMDCWINHCQQRAYDHNGDWARQGEVIPSLLSHMLQEPYLQLPAPKSTGRELFNLVWIQEVLQASTSISQTEAQSQANIQRTLLELTAVTICQAFESQIENQGKAKYPQLAVCGGGAHNPLLMDRLAALLPKVEVCSTRVLGIDPDWVEAGTFAWLASETLKGRRFNNQRLTGAQGNIILGGIYTA